MELYSRCKSKFETPTRILQFKLLIIINLSDTKIFNILLKISSNTVSLKFRSVHCSASWFFFQSLEVAGNVSLNKRRRSLYCQWIICMRPLFYPTPHCVDAIFPVFRIAVAVDSKSCTGQNHFPFQSIQRNFTVITPKKRNSKLSRPHALHEQHAGGEGPCHILWMHPRPRLACVKVWRRKRTCSEKSRHSNCGAWPIT